MTYTPHVWSRHDKLDSIALNDLEQAVAAFSSAQLTASDSTVAPIITSGTQTQEAVNNVIDSHMGLASTTAMRSVLHYVKGDGTDEGAALNSAVADVKAKGQGLHFPAGVVVTTSQTITVGPNIPIQMDSGSAIVYTGTGIAVDINAWSFLSPNRLMGRGLLRVRRSATGWDTGADTTSIGIRLRNAQFCDFRIPEVVGFETGLLLQGDGDGCCYNDLSLGDIVDNKRAIRFEGVNGGWANQNTFHGGAARHNSGFASYVGTMLVDMSTTGNNNTFIGTSLEGAYSETTASIKYSNNVFLNCRYELNGAGSFKLLSTTDSNQVIGGVGNGGPRSKMFSDASGGKNLIIGNRGMSSASDSAAGSGAQGNGGAAYEANATYSGSDILYRGRNTDSSVRYEVNGVGAAKYYGAGNPAYPNVIIDPSTAGGTSYGGLSWGRGNAAPDTRLSRGANGIPCWVSNAPWLKSVVSQTLAAAGAVTVTAKSGDVQQVNLQANATSVTIASPVLETGYAQQIELSMIQDATGSRTWVAPTNVMWAGGTAPTLTTTANARDIFTLRYDSTSSKWVEVHRSMGVR